MLTHQVFLHHKIHVLARKEDLPTVELAGKIVLVLDVLFATSTIITAMAHGVGRVIPALDAAAARLEGMQCPPGSFVLAGELHANTIDGFAPSSPLALLDYGVRDRTLIYSTTNGTIAINEAAGAEQIYAAALLNGAAVVDRVLAQHPRSDVVIVCSGSMGNFNLEDFYGAGYLVELFAKSLGPELDLSDGARAAQALFRSGKPFETLANCRVGRVMRERKLEHEVRHAAQLSTLEVVPKLAGRELVLA